MEQIAELKVINPLFFYNHPKLSKYPIHPKQLVLHGLNDIRTRALFGGNQSGKTTWGIADDLIQAVDVEVLPPHLADYKKWEPPFYCRIYTPDLADTLTVVQEKIKDLVPVQQLKGDQWDKAYDKLHRILRFKNGSWFQFMSYEQDAPKLGAATLHRNHYDEEPPLRVYEESQPRLIKYGGDEIFTMTPLQGLSWTYELIWKGAGGNEAQGEYLFINRERKLGVVVVDMDDNPSLTTEAKEDALRSFSQETRKARKEGRFVHFAGLIYSEFNKERHVLSKPYDAKNKNINVIVGIDPGMRYACGVVWLAVDIKDTVIAFDEFYPQGLTYKDVCAQIKKTNAYWNIDPIYYVIDPHARDKYGQTGRSDQQEFSSHGINTILGQNAVEAGINAVKERLETDRLLVSPTCGHLIDEFTKYRWKEPPRSRDEDSRPKPVKKEDHLMDALRYAVMSRPYLPDEALDDNRTWQQKLMEEDIENSSNAEPQNEFGGILY